MDDNQMREPGPDRCIGTTKGPGESAHEYTFVTPDPDRQVKAGEFVYYQTQVEGQTRQILGRVTDRVPLRLYPDSFMADPAVSPSQVAAMLGFLEQQHELFEVTVVVLGYYAPRLGDFVNPRVPPESGSPIYIADDETLAQVLSKTDVGDIGSAHIGSLLSRPLDAVPVTLDVRGFTSTHLAIIAGTGAGKSYLAGVLIEELMSPYNRACVLIVDPHGEYHTLQEIIGHEKFRDQGYEPEVRVIRPDQVKVRVSSLTLGDFRYLLPNLSEKMHYQLGRTYNATRRKYGDKWTLSQFMVMLRAGDEAHPVTDPDADLELEQDATIGALIWRVNSVLGHSKTFHDFEHMALGELFRPGQCTVLQLNDIDQREQQVIVATLLRRLNQARMHTEKRLSAEGDEDYLPYPTFVLIEEAHNYAPANAEVVTTRILKTVLSEGRKFGVSVGLISQRPGRLDSDVLSQCMTQCIMRIVNPIDQNRVAESVEAVGRDLLRELPALSKGQVIVAGTAVNTPLLCRVRQRITRHGAEDPDAPTRWQAYFSESAAASRQRDQALPLEGPRSQDPAADDGSSEKGGSSRMFK
jgi:DNA helicase HerA-like ATPase